MKASERCCKRCQETFDISNEPKRRDSTYPMCPKCQPYCSTCGELGEVGDDKCANCWEVEHRLRVYLHSEKGRAFVEATLAQVRQ